jgi:hypothetical protein
MFITNNSYNSFILFRHWGRRLYVVSNYVISDCEPGIINNEKIIIIA